MAPHRLVRINYGGKLPVSIEYQNLHSFKEVMIHLSQSILEKRRISRLHGSALFTIPLTNVILPAYVNKRCSRIITCKSKKPHFVHSLLKVDSDSVLYLNSLKLPIQMIKITNDFSTDYS